MPGIRSSSSDPAHLPPDEQLQALAKLINGKLRYGRIDFFIVAASAADDPPRYAIIFQSGGRRATIQLRHRPTEHDAGDIIAGMNSWADEDNEGPRYSTEPPEHRDLYVL
jgi:hypothetical protein